MSENHYRLGLDTGGTYTDVVVLDARQSVVASAKSPTTHHDLSQGIDGALSAILPAIDADSVKLICLSTTLATNALVEGRGHRVCLLLIGYDQASIRRAGLHEALAGDPHVFVEGGHDAAGEENQALDMHGVRDAVEGHANDVDAFAISAMFSVRNASHEVRARDLVRTLTDKPVSCGHELSSALDAPRRALTALFNGRLIPRINALLDATSQVLQRHGLDAPVMVVKGDGTLIRAEVAAETPVETILSGPAASVVGAQHLARHRHQSAQRMIVSDMGGTTTDIALLENGHPQLDPSGATVGGWRTMVNAVRISTYGLGGDSAIRFDRIDRDLSIGPDRWRPLVSLIREYPELMSELDRQAEADWVPTHAGQFVVSNVDLSSGTMPAGLSRTQLELFCRVREKPLSLITLFEDQTLQRALNRLIERGHVMMSGFTPTDASHILGKQANWPKDAAELGARLLARYSANNLGCVFDSVGELAGYVAQRVAEKSAAALVEVSLAEEEGRRELRLSEGERRFLSRSFGASRDGAVTLQARLKQPIVALGAPVNTYYPEVATLLDTELVMPLHHATANALGAAVGFVRQKLVWAITPAGGKRVRVHAGTETRFFDDLESAVLWAKPRMESIAQDRATHSGADTVRLEFERLDNIVEKDGESVFFESTLTMYASGEASV